jgi:uncharacterized protein (TIGR02246 family)
MPGTTTGTEKQASVDRSLEATLKRFNEAFNRLEPKEVASYFAEDGTLLTPGGHYGKGRAGIERVFREDKEAILDGTTSTFTIVGARPVGSDCVFLDVDHELRNFRMPDGSTGTMKLHVIMLARREGRDWQWLDVRPYAFIQEPPHVH